MSLTMRKQIMQIWNGAKKVCETTNTAEIEYYRKLGYQVVKTGSYVVTHF